MNEHEVQGIFIEELEFGITVTYRNRRVSDAQKRQLQSLKHHSATIYDGLFGEGCWRITDFAKHELSTVGICEYCTNSTENIFCRICDECAEMLSSDWDKYQIEIDIVLKKSSKKVRKIVKRRKKSEIALIDQIKKRAGK